MPNNRRIAVHVPFSFGHHAWTLLFLDYLILVVLKQKELMQLDLETGDCWEAMCC